MNKRCIIFGAASLGKAALTLTAIRPDDLLLCADGGLRHALKWGLTPHALIGDFDSMQSAERGVQDSRTEVLRLPAQKDVTDTQACVDYGLARGRDDFWLLGCSGGPRLDHFLGNLSLLEYCAGHGARGRLLDDDHLFLLHAGGRMELPEAREYRYFSLFPLETACTGVTLEGFAFPLAGATVPRAGTLAVSNAPLGDGPAAVTLTGRAVIVMSERKCGQM